MTMTNAPESLLTTRLRIRRPTVADTEAVFSRYASDPEVCRYMAWPRHARADITRRFLEWSDVQWATWPCGPCVIFDRTTGVLLGGTGMVFEAPGVAAAGYVLARDAWGHGYATEALLAMVEVAKALALERFYAICHIDHRASQRVLEKAGFGRESSHGRKVVFPNLSPDPQDVASYVWPVAMAPGAQ